MTTEIDYKNSIYNQQPPIDDDREHFIAVSSDMNPALISVHLNNTDGENNVSNMMSQGHNMLLSVTGENQQRMIQLNQGDKPFYPKNPIPVNDRIPLQYHPQGYVHISGSSDKNWENALNQMIMQSNQSGSFHDSLDDNINNNMNSNMNNNINDNINNSIDNNTNSNNEEPFDLSQYVSNDDFGKLLDGYRDSNGKFLAMTAYGAVPLPDQMLQNIPEKFVTKPLVQENDVFVLKQEHHMRVLERDFIQFEHHFVNIPKCLPINKIETVEDVKVVEIPHFKYKPVVEDKIVEVPKGTKYVEVPIEVPLRMPPKIVPIPKPHIVERIIEQTKPVVQEKIVEVIEIVKKKVPKIVVKDIPYIVPKYVEKIIEIPYYPGQQLPQSQGIQLTVIPKPPPIQGSHADYLRLHMAQHTHPGPQQEIPYIDPNESNNNNQPGVENQTETLYFDQLVKTINLPYEASIQVSVVPSNSNDITKNYQHNVSELENYNNESGEMYNQAGAIGENLNDENTAVHTIENDN